MFRPKPAKAVLPKEQQQQPTVTLVNVKASSTQRDTPETNAPAQVGAAASASQEKRPRSRSFKNKKSSKTADKTAQIVSTDTSTQAKVPARRVRFAAAPVVKAASVNTPRAVKLTTKKANRTSTKSKKVAHKRNRCPSCGGGKDDDAIDALASQASNLSLQQTTADDSSPMDVSTAAPASVPDAKRRVDVDHSDNSLIFYPSEEEYEDDDADAAVDDGPAPMEREPQALTPEQQEEERRLAAFLEENDRLYQKELQSAEESAEQSDERKGDSRTSGRRAARRILTNAKLATDKSTIRHTRFKDSQRTHLITFDGNRQDIIRKRSKKRFQYTTPPMYAQPPAYWPTFVRPEVFPDGFVRHVAYPMPPPPGALVPFY